MELPKIIDDQYVEEKLRETAERFVSSNPITEFVNEGLCGKDLTNIDMSNLSIENFKRLTFDSRTIFSQEQIEKFHPFEDVLENGKKFANQKNIGHNGKRTTIAIVDRFSNISNEQFGGEVTAYRVSKNGVEIVEPNSQNIYFKSKDDSEDRGFHGDSCASFAAGKECGVSPNSDVILFDIDKGITFEDAQREVLKFLVSNKDNKDFIMPDIISVSADTGIQEYKKELDELKGRNCAFINSKIIREIISWGRMNDDGTVSQDQFVQDMLEILSGGNEQQKSIHDMLMKDTIVPVTGRTCSYLDNDGNEVYRYQGSFCGNSFAIPQIGGLLLRAREIDESISFDDFVKIVTKQKIFNFDDFINEVEEKRKLNSIKKVRPDEINELVEKIMEDDDCIYFIHGTGINYNSIGNKQITSLEKTKDEDGNYVLNEDAQKIAKRSIDGILNEGLYMREDNINISAINLETQAHYNIGGNRFMNENGMLGKKRPESSKGILEDYIKNGYEKYPIMNGMIILAIPKECLSGEKPLFEYDEEGKDLAGITGCGSTLHYRIPKEYIKGAILKPGPIGIRDEMATYFFENELYDKNKSQKSVEHESKIKHGNKNINIEEIKKQMEWYHNGHTMLTVSDIDRYCTEYGLDFNKEMQQAKERAEFRNHFDQMDLSTYNMESPAWKQVSDRASKIGLNIEYEIDLSNKRTSLRKEMRNYFLGKSEMTIEEINDQCSELGLNYNYEMTSARDSNDRNDNDSRTVITPTQIGKATINVPTRAKQEAKQMEEANIRVDEKLNEGESIDNE